MKMSVINNSNEQLAQTFYKGVMVTVEKTFGTIVMTKGNRVYSQCGKFAPVPKSLTKLFNEMVKAIEEAAK